MGLNDPYYNQPWTPMTQVLQQANQGLDTLGQLPMRQAQVTAQQQQNAANAYTAPQAQASDHRTAIAKTIQQNLFGGAPPGYAERFQQEMSQGPSLAQPGGPATQGPRGLSAPPNDLDVVSGGSGMGGRSTGAPAPNIQMPPPGPGYGIQQPRPDSDERQFLGDTTGVAQRYNGDMTGMQRPAAMPQAQQAPMGRPAHGGGVTAPQTPMTNYDVDSYMKMPRANMEAEKLAEKKREFDAMMDYRGRALAAKERLGRLAAAAKESVADNDRKRALELLRIEVDREKAGVLAQAKVYSGLYGIVNEQGTQAYLNYLDSFIQDAQAGSKGAEEQPTQQPIQQMNPGGFDKPKGPPTPRPLSGAKPAQKGKTISVVNKKTGATKTITQEQYDASPHKGDWEVVR